MRFLAVRLVVGVVLASVGVVESARAQRRLPRLTYEVAPYSDVVATSLPVIAAPLPEERSTPVEVVRESYRSVQVNVDAWGQNIVGDASNEPSITIDPNNPRRMAIGWRQFNAPNSSSLREAGVGFTRDGGPHWTFRECLAPGLFGSDPVLDVDGGGQFFYLSTSPLASPQEFRLFTSTNGGASWSEPIRHGGSYDKLWIAIDKTNGAGRGNIYLIWNSGSFMRSVDGGATFTKVPFEELGASAGAITIGPDGVVYLSGFWGDVFRSRNALYSDQDVIFDLQRDLHYYELNISYRPTPIGSPNWGGLVGQPWMATDYSGSAAQSNVYWLALADYEVRKPFRRFQTVLFRRSVDRGETWSDPVRINDDPPHDLIFAWFPMMSVAPNGRIDVVWNDTRNSPLDEQLGPEFSELFYSYSNDAGETWSPNEPVSPPFNHFVGYPGGSQKLGDYYTMVSDNLGVNVAYAATFNGEQDIWYLRLGSFDCNGNDIADEDDIANGTSMNCNNNDIPDECEHAPDANGDGRVNLADYATFQTCFTGSGATLLGGWPMSFGHGGADDRYPRHRRSSPPPPPKEVGHPTFPRCW